jgi:hypothetical protein
MWCGIVACYLDQLIPHLLRVSRFSKAPLFAPYPHSCQRHQDQGAHLVLITFGLHSATSIASLLKLRKFAITLLSN